MMLVHPWCKQTQRVHDWQAPGKPHRERGGFIADWPAIRAEAAAPDGGGGSLQSSAPGAAPAGMGRPEIATVPSTRRCMRSSPAPDRPPSIRNRGAGGAAHGPQPPCGAPRPVRGASPHETRMKIRLPRVVRPSKAVLSTGGSPDKDLAIPLQQRGDPLSDHTPPCVNARIDAQTEARLREVGPWTSAHAGPSRRRSSASRRLASMRALHPHASRACGALALAFAAMGPADDLPARRRLPPGPAGDATPRAGRRQPPLD